MAGAGFEVLIPERGRPDLLAGTLEALAQARIGLAPPHAVRVLVNGTAPQDYAGLLRRHPDVRFAFEPRALGFHGAIARLLAQAEQPWVYLLNSDMRLHADALRTILPWRAGDLFAIASQIEFADASRRREETGYTVPVRGPDGQLELHDRLPVDASVRAHLYAGGGASLFQTAALRRYLALSHAYAPFYFEDADWGMQAWADGLRVLFCPQSQAVHEHRATIGRYVPARTVERIVSRNLAHFRWRYGDLFGAPRCCAAAFDRLAALARQLRSEHRRARQRVLAGSSLVPWTALHHQRYPHPQRWRDGNPRVLLVSPFAPQRAGAARSGASIDLVRASADQIDWVLLHAGASDEPEPAPSDDDCFREIHPIPGRSQAGADPQPALLAALQRAIATCQPHLLCFEHVECIGLIEQMQGAIPIIWRLPEGAAKLPPALQRRLRASLHKVAALVPEQARDGGHWQHRSEQAIALDERSAGAAAANVQRWLALVQSLVPRETPASGLCPAMLRDPTTPADCQ